MSFSIYQASVPVLLRNLKALSKILDKTAADAKARKIDPAVIINYRLAPDMFNLARQVMLVTDFAKGCGARLAGVDVPKYEDTEATFPELKARIAKTIKFLKSLKAKQFEGAETRQISLPVAGKPMTLDGQTYLLSLVMPNFYFHMTTAYAIARHCGVPLGKSDFMGRT